MQSHIPMSEGFHSRNRSWSSQLSRIPSIARSSFPVLILGPSGTGKEVIAEALHRGSGRIGQLVKVNCSALTESLIESELFGHCKGSFTGAMSDRKGAFETARGGTLFLDEIGDLPLGLQAKLLRALENQEIKPVGSDRVIKVDVRIVAATHQNLPDHVLQKKFRMDLYYRLNVISIPTPALKDRLEDFDSLFFHFARKFRVRASYSAMACLKRYPWPGNIRELKNTVARASVLFGDKRLDEADIPELLGEDSQRIPQGDYQNTFKQFERSLILKTLRYHRGNQRRTAASLGIPKSTLHDRLKTYGILAKDFKV